jgi:hypothetical protein
MNQIKLAKFNPKFFERFPEHRSYWTSKFLPIETTVFAVLGEFAHAPGHYMLSVFGSNHAVPGMIEIADNEEEAKDVYQLFFIDRHPDDFVFELSEEDLLDLDDEDDEDGD